MMDIGVGSIITNGLGGPACNLLIFGPFHLYIEPFTPFPTVTPSPTVSQTPGLPTPTPSPTVPTPSPTPSPGIGGGGGGGSGAGSWDDDHTTPDDKKYKLVFVVTFRGRKVKRTFIVDSFKKDKIIKRVGQINTLRLKFKVAWNKVKNNRFTALWKK